MGTTILKDTLMYGQLCHTLQQNKCACAIITKQLLVSVISSTLSILQNVFIINTQVKIVTCKSVFIVEQQQKVQQLFIAKPKAKNDDNWSHPYITYVRHRLKHHIKSLLPLASSPPVVLKPAGPRFCHGAGGVCLSRVWASLG